MFGRNDRSAIMSSHENAVVDCKATWHTPLMPRKEWEHWLSDQCYMLVDRITNDGRVVSFRVILLAIIGDELHCITRYDTAHGYAHRDILAFGGEKIMKQPMPYADFDVAFRAAVTDIQLNYERYLKDFESTRS